MAQSLLIAQAGRSGGVWLTQALRHDKRWCVEHELGGLQSSRKSLFDIRARFNQDCRYCEITHLQNEIAHNLHDCRKAVIIRNPIEVFESYAARELDSRQRFIHRVDGMYAGMDRMLEGGALLIPFYAMLTDRKFFSQMLSTLGFDIDLSVIDWTPKNVRKKHVQMPDHWVPILNRNAMAVWNKWS